MFFRTIMFLIIGFIMWFAGLVWFIDDMPQGSPQPTLKTSVIVVLTGGNNRISKGLWLLSQNKSDTLLISGVKKESSLRSIIHGSGYKGSVDFQKVILDYNSTTTVENAQNVARWATYHPITSLRLVTANYHMKRALIEFSQHLKGVRVIPHAVNPLDPVRNAWCKDYKVFCLYINEYHKYLGAFARMAIRHFYRDSSTT